MHSPIKADQILIFLLFDLEMMSCLKLNTCQSVVVAFKGVQALASGYVPEHDLSISGHADNLVVLRPYGVDWAVMS